jgi:hypothetical protein
MLNLKVVAGSLGLSGAVLFISCVIYGLIAPESLHSGPTLEVVFPGFRWLTPGGFLIGLVWSTLYGLYAGVVFTLIYNAVWKRAQYRAT